MLATGVTNATMSTVRAQFILAAVPILALSIILASVPLGVTA